MAYASLQGRASPKRGAAAVCDRCGRVDNHINLQWQNDWRGPVIQNLRILVCRECLDRPQQQLRAIVVPADPVPIMNARPQDFANAETDYRAVAYAPMTDPATGIPVYPDVLRVTEDCENRTLIPYGVPAGLEQQAIMPLGFAGQGFGAGPLVPLGVVLPVLSATASGTTVTITCSSVHNLQPGAQISVAGLTAGNGFYTVAVPTATVFTYQTAQPVTPALTSGVRIVTA